MHSPSAEPAPRFDPIEAEPRRILVAEDEHLVAMHLVKSLRQMKYDVVGPAPNGEEALQLAQDPAKRPDLAIVDIRMPGADGITVANTLFDQHDVPVIILSAFSDPRIVEEAALNGVFGYLLKPAMLEDLRVNIAVAWNRYREHVRLMQEIQHLKRRLGE